MNDGYRSLIDVRRDNNYRDMYIITEKDSKKDYRISLIDKNTGTIIRESKYGFKPSIKDWISQNHTLISLSSRYH